MDNPKIDNSSQIKLEMIIITVVVDNIVGIQTTQITLIPHLKQEESLRK
jgi:hypothetical protein